MRLYRQGNRTGSIIGHVAYPKDIGIVDTMVGIPIPVDESRK